MTTGAVAIPARANLALIALVYVAVLALLWAGARAPLWAAVALGVAMSFVLLTNYALMHEAMHDVLNPDPRWNWALGALCGVLFPAAFTMFRVGHRVHHCCNRTDHEMFDLYYPGDSRVLKYGQWYGLLTGLYYPLVPLGSVLLAISPRILQTAPFRKARTSSLIFRAYDRRAVTRIRVEVVAAIAFWWGALTLLALEPLHLAVMYACFGFNWATRQYVTHAFTPRDVVNGALNLRVSRPMRWCLLNGNWDLVHHQQPWLPWTALPAAGRRSAPPESFWRQYLRLWRGPRPTLAPGPAPLADEPRPS